MSTKVVMYRAGRCSEPRTYTGDYQASWYAVSLIPRTSVTGQGMLLMAVPFLVTLTSSVLFALSLLCIG